MLAWDEGWKALRSLRCSNPYCGFTRLSTVHKSPDNACQDGISEPTTSLICLKLANLQSNKVARPNSYLSSRKIHLAFFPSWLRSNPDSVRHSLLCHRSQQKVEIINCAPRPPDMIVDHSYYHRLLTSSLSWGAGNSRAKLDLDEAREIRPEG